MKTLLLATTVAILAPAAALAAQPIYYAPTSTAFANTFGHPSQVSLRVDNGAIDPGGTYGAAFGTQSASSSVDGRTNTAAVVSNTGNASTVTSNLSEGTVRAATTNGNGPVNRSFATAVIADTLYFNNTSGDTIFLAYSFAYDGVISGAESGNSAAISTLYTYGYGGCDENFASCLGGLELTGGASPSAGLNITNYGDGRTVTTNYGDPRLGSAYTVTNNNVGNSFNTIISTVLAIPVGYNLFSFRLGQDLDCTGAYTVCDFSQTSKFSFSGLPAGLEFSSASGVFQIAAPGGGVGGVPEPTTWALMILGFGAAGAMLRRRPLVA